MTPGLIALLGSGETSPAAGVVYDMLTRTARAPLQVAILETPAGFQPNADRVAGKVSDYVATRLQQLRPQMRLLPARARGTDLSPDSPAATAGLREAGLIFLGPGSPTYTVRQLQGSLAWERLVARVRRGVPLATASAATIAMGAMALPVYEIYKVGADLHWQPGLDLLRPYGLSLVFVPHWDNAEGGAELDTSRCFMGRERFARLLALLPADLTVVGIDEHTGLVLDLGAGVAHVLGRGGVTLIRG
ncbi:MAG: cysteinyl-tRNA synthetase, partial [Chloroflexales bacterium]|nr:cysteinyl-tRNA synthetase [Chloroflexales bacterium]